jgi:hypothetical protein
LSCLPCPVSGCPARRWVLVLRQTLAAARQRGRTVAVHFRENVTFVCRGTASEKEVVVVVGDMVCVQVGHEDVLQVLVLQASSGVLRDRCPSAVDEVDRSVHDQGTGNAGALTLDRRPSFGPEKDQLQTIPGAAGFPRLGDTVAEAALANEDTFHYTNAAPQAAKFNQGMELWLSIEDHIQEHAAQYRSRVVVFTGPIFTDLDPVYRGVDIPLRFFKVAAFIHQGELAATGYVLDQTPQLADIPEVPRPGALEDVPPLGLFRTFQTPVRDIAELTNLDMEQLIAVDRMPIAATLGAARVGSTWRLLGDVEDLDLDFDLED